MGRLAAMIAPYGAPAESVVALHESGGDEADVRRIRYLDLIGVSRADEPTVTRLLDGVVELRNEGVAYLVDATKRSPDVPEVSSLRRVLSFRDDAPYLAIIEPGRLVIYGVALDRRTPEEALLRVVPREQPDARSTFHTLQLAAIDVDPNARHQAIHELLFQLMTRAIQGLIEDHLIERNDAISLAGRALFVRFLIDRGVLKPGQLRHVCPGARTWQEIFSTHERIRATCRWLDETFNGDFLPVSLFSPGEVPPAGRTDRTALSQKACEFLSAIMRRSAHVAIQQDLPLKSGAGDFDWPDLDFAHIPVGVLSQVYEHQAEHWNPLHKKATSVYYTPRRIAEYMVREAFAGLALGDQEALHRARVLDPAVGAGVFLVAVLRELVAAWWRRHRRPPGSRQLRKILYQQVTGFDIHEPALRLSALSLYLTVIELDPNPDHLADLRFDEPLRGSVLFRVCETEWDGDPVAGSLGASVGPEHRGVYDLVIGNPPWNSIKGGHAIEGEVLASLRPIVEDRLGAERGEGFRLRDMNPDLPFVWRAMEWAKPDGWIAFALHARVLFQQVDASARVRADLFRAMTLMGVLNGADLRRTPVWPAITAPFCLLFAVNRRAAEDASFYVISPHHEPGLNEQGRLRIDASSAHRVSVEQLIRRTPETLKVLFRGNNLDLELLERIRRGRPRLIEWWTARGLCRGEGYREAGSRRKRLPFLVGKHDLRSKRRGFGYVIDPESLPRFADVPLGRRRAEGIYRGPMVLIRESPVPDHSAPRAPVCDSDLAYRESYFGYSAFGHEEARAVVRYVALLCNSDLFLWHALVTSAKFGVERDAIQTRDVDVFPITPWEKLDVSERERARQIFGRLPARDERPSAGLIEDLEHFVAHLYQLSRWDLDVIRDTLAHAAPFTAARERAVSAPNADRIARFAARIREEIAAFIPDVVVDPEPLERSHSPWHMILVDASSRGADASTSAPLLTPQFDEFTTKADHLGASQLMLVDPGSRRLVVGILRQARYWTETRARLCAGEILADHLDALIGRTPREYAS